MSHVIQSHYRELGNSQNRLLSLRWLRSWAVNLFQRKTPANHPEDVISKDNNNNDGNFICVFECTIVNLATYRQFTNAG